MVIVLAFDETAQHNARWRKVYYIMFLAMLHCAKGPRTALAGTSDANGVPFALVPGVLCYEAVTDLNGLVDKWCLSWERVEIGLHTSPCAAAA